MNKICLVCNTISFQPIYKNILLKCSSCGFVTVNMELDPEILSQTYTKKYFEGEEYVDYLGDKEIIQTNFKKRLNYIFKYIDKSDITNVLEIGCAYGFFAELINRELKNVNYAGYDVVPEAIEYGSKILEQNVFCEDYLKTEMKNKLSDIFMWDVIEHLPNSEKFIEKIARELKQGGRIYITTGDIDCLIPRFRKEKWRMIHPPSHLHYFSKKTLTLLLENNGFKIINVSYPPTHRSLKLIYYSLFMLRKKYSPFVEKIYEMIPQRMSMSINTHDILFLIAQKK